MLELEVTPSERKLVENLVIKHREEKQQKAKAENETPPQPQNNKNKKVQALRPSSSRQGPFSEHGSSRSRTVEPEVSSPNVVLTVKGEPPQVDEFTGDALNC